MINKKPFYFLRHGETDANLHGLFCGSYDPPLNATGLNQAHALQDQLKRTNAGKIFSSHLSRAKATAAIASTFLQVEHEIIEGLHECNFGILEKQRISRESERQVAQWLAGNTPVGAEPYVEFYARIARTINHCLHSYDGTPLIVAHGGVFMTLSSQLGYEDNPIKLVNCELVQVIPIAGSSKWQIINVGTGKVKL